MLLQQNNNEYQRLVDRSMLGLRKSTGAQSPGTAASPVIDLVNLLIEQAIADGASDIHLEPAGEALRVRLRIDGRLTEPVAPLPAELQSLVISRLKIMSRLDTTDRQHPLDGRITYPYRGREIDIRVSTLPLLGGEKIVLRLLNTANQLLDIKELNFSAAHEALFRAWCKKPDGLIINCGPVNSGKTTSLYAALTMLNRPDANLTTIEDPVEYDLPGINQLQVNPATGLTFASGLRAILRQDPDILMIGEIRDSETADIAIRADITGRLVLSTLHAPDTAGAIIRLLDMGAKPYLLADSLIGITAQRLVRRLCPACREAYTVQDGTPEAQLLGALFRPGLTLYRAKGCPACRQTGYQGRLAIHELLPMSEELHDAILRQSPARTLRTLALSGGMRTLLQDGLSKALQGETSLEEISRVV